MSRDALAHDKPIGNLQGHGLLTTKLYARPAPASLVTRPRIIQLLEDGLSASLILVSAPAGFGKTTLLTEWLSAKDEGGRQEDKGKPSTIADVHPQSSFNHPLKTAWLSLDAADNDPVRFWAYVILSLQALRDELGETQLTQLRSPQPPPIQIILPNLLNEMDSFQDSGILVLDDYHLITSTVIHSSLSYLLENLPPSMHLVISTRSDPPIPIARLRSRGRVAEIRTDNLRFTPGEAAAFLNQTMGLALSSEQVAALDDRTEGWIAGLQMAALSMRGRDADRVDGFIRAFAGTQRFIMDYLLEEVLAQEPDQVQSFLLQTAILARLTGSLCDAVAGSAGGQAMLESLERRNLFVVPLDDDRMWYRYHHLFADLLRTQLQNSFGDRGVARLHLRASEWYEKNGHAFEAVRHASLASDFERVEQLIEQYYIDMMNRGEMSYVRSWMGEWSKNLVYRRPWLCLYEAFSRSWFGQLDEADLLLAEADKRIREFSAPDTRAMLGYHTYVSSRVTAMRGDTRRAIELCLVARENIPAENLGLQIEVGITLGYEYFLYGDFDNADRTLTEMVRLGYTVRAINNPVAAFALLARMRVIQGRLHDAHDLYEKAASLIHQASGQHLGAVGLADVGPAALLCESNDVEAALVRINQGLEFLPWWSKADDLALTYLTLSRIQLARGNRMGALAALDKAAQTITSCGVFSEARTAVEAAQVRMWLTQGDESAVARWSAAVEQRLHSPDSFRFEDELTRIIQARVFIAQKQLDKALELLSSLEALARSGARQGRLIEILVLKALALQAMGEIAQAESALTASLSLAEPEGYIRLFVDEGEPLRCLMAQCRLRIEKTSPNLSAYMVKLLAAFGSSTDQSASGVLRKEKTLMPPQPPSGSDKNLVEPLSKREVEVLRLMAEGLTNEQIAAKLIIALGTVKAHVHNISGKLGAQNRAHAVARAKELNLL